MVMYADHAGSCCGIKTAWSFDYATREEFETVYNNHFVRGNNNRLLEVVLSERQVNLRTQGERARMLEDWPAILAEKGFTLVNRFRNSNTGRICYVFHKLNERLPMSPEYLPFNWPADQIEPGVQPVAPVIREVSREYYASLRVGRRGPFATEGQARESFPRCRNFEERIIMSNGESTWQPLVRL